MLSLRLLCGEMPLWHTVSSRAQGVGISPAEALGSQRSPGWHLSTHHSATAIISSIIGVFLLNGEEYITARSLVTSRKLSQVVLFERNKILSKTCGFFFLFFFSFLIVYFWRFDWIRIKTLCSIPGNADTMLLEGVCFGTLSAALQCNKTPRLPQLIHFACFVSSPCVETLNVSTFPVGKELVRKRGQCFGSQQKTLALSLCLTHFLAVFLLFYTI